MMNERYAAVADLMGYDHGEHVASMARLTPRMARTITTEGLGVENGSRELEDHQPTSDEIYERVLGKDALTVPENQRRDMRVRLYTVWLRASLAGYRDTMYARAHEMVGAGARAMVNHEHRNRVGRVVAAWRDES